VKKQIPSQFFKSKKVNNIKLIHLDTQKTQERARTIAEKTTEIPTTITSTIITGRESTKKNLKYLPV